MDLKKTILNYLPKSIKGFFKERQSLKNYNPLQFKNPVYASSLAALKYYKCIFVHIPKNAGLSVSYAIFGNTGGSHRKIIDYKDLFSKKQFKKYYKFTFVRNPWDRLVSTYFFLKKGGLTDKDKVWAEKHLGQYDNFKDFVSGWLIEENISNSLHFQHQHVFLENENGKIEVDFIGRFENLESDFKIVTKNIGIDRELKKTNVSHRDSDYRKYYDTKTANIVRKVYSKDIELFNYEF